MEPDPSPLAESLGDESNGYLISADSSGSNQLYLSGFDVPDPYAAFYTPAETHLLVSTLGFDRAKKESRTDTASRLSDYNYRDDHVEHGAAVKKAKTVAAFFVDHGVDPLAVPADFPFDAADTLREEGIVVDAETDDVLTNIYAVKANEGVEHIHAVQDANEATMCAAEGLVHDADVADDGMLTYEGEPLTGERIREEIEVVLLCHGCTLDETIVIHGVDAADPHDRGGGPLRTDEAITVDIFPRNRETKYNSDMTQTLVKSESLPEIREWFDLAEEAFEAVPDAVEPDATGEDVHDVVYDMYETAGESTLRVDPSTKTGFIHSTDHGVDPGVRELPSLSPSSEELRLGHVITIELGLYDPEIGGVRTEDLVVAIEDSYENLTEYPVELVVG